VARISFDVSDRLDEAYRKLALQKMQSKASEIRRAMEEYLEREKKKG
jgi:predicted transcriptional regulator